MRPLTHVIDEAVVRQAERCAAWPWQVTQHAAERYRARVEPRLEPAGATILLQQLLPDATLQAEPTFLGQQRWMLPGGRAVVVCKPDPKLQRRIAVTVLGPHEMYESEAVAEVVEAYQRATAEHEAPKRAPAPETLPEFTPLAAPPTMPQEPKIDWQRRYSNLLGTHHALRDDHRRLLEAYKKAKARPSQGEVDSLRCQLAAAQRDAARAKERAAAPAPAEPALVTRLRAHAEHEGRRAALMKNLLRTAIVALRASGGPDAASALAELEAIEPGITGDHFCYPERFTREERRAAKAASGSCGEVA